MCELDQKRLTTQERLELFIPVCEAVAHAHQKAIIHRDLKPSNILVAEYDDRSVPKIIDFGIAKAVDQKLTEKTYFTHYGQLVGTIEYMSPEQSKLNQKNIDTRSDIYSLGVILYELLVGSTPFDANQLRTADFETALRVIREKDPPTPSSRLATGDVASIASKRQTEPNILSRLLRGDLDWIVMKCLEKDRARRYKSASDLAEDLQHHLNNEAVSARPPTFRYRLRTSIRRNRLLYAMGAAILMSLLLGSYVSTLQAIRASQQAVRATKAENEQRRARHDAERERDRALRTIYAAEMSRAKRELDSQMFGEAKNIVEKYKRPKLRGFRDWAWQYLWQQTQSDELATVGRHDYGVDCVRFSPDGRYVVSSGKDRRVIVWDVDRRAKVAQIPHPAAIVALDVSADGEIVTKCENEDVLRFAFLPDSDAHGQPARKVALDESMSPVHSIRYSPDGRWLALLRENKLQLRHVRSKQVDKEIAIDGGRQLAFSADNTLLAVATKNGEVTLLDSQPLVATSTLSCSAPVWETSADKSGNLEFSRNGEWLAYAGGKTAKRLVAWNLKDGQTHVLTEGRQFGSQWVGKVRFSHDSARMISVGNDRRISLWDWDDQEQQWSVTDSRLGHEGDIWALDVSPSGNTMVTASSDTTVRLWNTSAHQRFGLRREFAGNQFVRTFHIGGMALHDLSWGGRYAVIRGHDNHLKLCDTRAGIVRKLPFTASCAQISADGCLIAVEQNKIIRLYRKALDRESWDQVAGPDVVPASKRWPDAPFRFSTRQAYLAVAQAQGGVYVWKMDGGNAMEIPATNRKIEDLTFSPDESLLAVISHQHLKSACDVYDLRRQKRILHMDGGPGTFSAARILAGNAVVATADEHASVSLWILEKSSRDSNPSEPFAHFGEARAGLRAFACSPNGRLLVTVGAWDEQIHLWDSATQQEVLVLKSSVPVWSLDFSPDGNILTAACGVKVHRWDVPSLDEITAAETGN